MAGDGKHAHLEVPDFNGGMASYLRLGTAAPLGSLPGDDLAERITAFIDDDRRRDGCPEFVPPGERAAESDELHTKGGWRDHSDGNRISTTGGDKIEVIGGNYKLLVLGRGDHESGWDISGGHVTEVTATFAGGTSIEWVQDYDGTWKTSETTVKGQAKTVYHGDVVDHYYGKLKASYTGTESPGSSLRYTDDVLDDSKDHPVQTVTKENPEVLDRTWAKKIETYTGSEKLRIPLIHEETWAEEMRSKTRAKSMTDETTVDEESKSTTKAKTITSITKAEAMKDTTEVAGTIESTTKAAKIVSTTHADSEDTTYGDSNSYTKGDSVTIVDGIENTINIGMVNEVVLGMMNDATIGLETGASIGGSLNLTVGADVSFSLTAKLEVDATSSIEISPAKIELTLDTTQVALTRKVLSAMNLYF